MIKTCRKCGRSAEHYASITTACKECWKLQVKANRKEKAEYYREFDRKRSKTPKRKAVSVRRTREMRRRVPGLMKAHNALFRAISNGIIVRPDHCSRCLISCVPQGHHDDYSKPLEVMWLCPICHAQRHKELGKI